MGKSKSFAAQLPKLCSSFLTLDRYHGTQIMP